MKCLRSLLCVIIAASTAHAQIVDPQNVLIRNVHILQGDVEDVTVSMLIRDNKLEIVSKDEISTPDGVLALDANGGYVIGTLQMGEAPSFIILGEDPRDNFDVLLDTETHVVFAVHQGQLRKSNLSYDAGALEEPEEEPERVRHVIRVAQHDITISFVTPATEAAVQRVREAMLTHGIRA